MPKPSPNKFREGGCLYAMRHGQTSIRAKVAHAVIRSPFIVAGADGLFGASLSQTYRHNGGSHD
jgi:hypothetical protein